MSSEKSFSSAPGILSRRELLSRAYNGIGALALAGMLGEELGGAPRVVDPLAIKPPHMPRKAKHCIFLFMSGGVSQMDSFDYKPALAKLEGKRLPVLDGVGEELQAYLRVPHEAFPSPFNFTRRGQCGRPIADLFPHIGQFADELAFVYGIKVDNNNHGPATMHVNTGSIFQGNPSVGSWVTYGLGSANKNLPGYVVIQDPRGGPVNGSLVWSSGFLPSVYQGTLFRSSGPPILNLRSPQGLTRERQRREFDLLKQLNEQHLEGRPGAAELEARIQAYELSFRMQMEATQVVDIDQESDTTKAMYGLDNPVTEGFGRQCLLARRQVENGVRHVLLVHGVSNRLYSWDDHGDIPGRMPRHAAEVDQPVGALLTDLKQRGLLDDTLVVWASEMGRTSMFVRGMNDINPKTPGRDHNQYGLVMWLAGGDVKGGSTAGQTDEFGMRALEEPIPLRDVHATILDLLGLNHERLRYFHDGRSMTLTENRGKVLTDVIA